MSYAGNGTSSRNRDQRQKFCETTIGELRRTYGADFAKGCADHEKVADVLRKLPSLRRVIREQRQGGLSKFEGQERGSKFIRCFVATLTTCGVHCPFFWWELIRVEMAHRGFLRPIPRDADNVAVKNLA